MRIVVVDDHELFRAGVRGELGARFEIVGEAGSVAEAVPLIRDADPDVVLLDVHLPDGGGEAVIAAAAPDRPGVKFLALSVSDAAEDVIGVIRGGARGYVTKTITGADLVDAIFRVADGDAVFSPRLAGFVLGAFASTDALPVDEDLDRLTEREREVLRLIAQGLSNAEIAQRRFVGEATVKTHVARVLAKLGLRDRVQAVVLAYESGVVRTGGAAG